MQRLAIATNVRLLSMERKLWDPGADRFQESAIIPIAKHHPLVTTCTPQVVRSEGVLVPAFGNIHDAFVDNAFFEDWALERHEWLGLVALQSPRIRADDEIDPYLSRYSVPDRDLAVISDVVVLTWSGFIPALWIKGLFLELRYANRNPSPEFFDPKRPKRV